MTWLSLVGVIIAGLIALNRYTVWKARRAEALYPPAGRFVEVEGLRLHYVRRGSGPPVVLLHGSDGFLEDFTPTIDLLARDYDVIAFDRPGHGYSDAPAHEAPTSVVQARLIRGALRSLEVTRPILVGHSWSGSLLMVYGLDYPDEVAGLVLLGGWVYASKRPFPLLDLPQVPILGELLSSTLLTVVKRALIDWNLRLAFYPDPVPGEYSRQARAMWQRWPWQTRVFARENTADRALLAALHPRYPLLSVPLVIVTGDSDRAVDPDQHARRLHAEIPNSELIVLPQSGHELPQTRPREVLQAVQQCDRMAGEMDRSRTAPAQPDVGRSYEAAPTRSLSEFDKLVSAAKRDVLVGRGEPSPAETPGERQDRYLRARELIFRYGWNAASYQILNPDTEYWFSSEGSAVIGYVTRYRVRVVAGAPVCDESRLPAVIVEFEQAAAQNGERVCFFGAASRVRDALAHLPVHSSIGIGAQPVWDPANWSQVMAQNAPLRKQVNRARNKGVAVSEWPAERARNSPELQRCLEEWMEARPLPPLHFLTESVSLDRLADRRVFVAEIETVPVGFLVIIPVPDRNGWLVEQIVRGHRAPNGTPAMLIDSMMRAVAEAGSRYVTLGLAPLSRRAPASFQSRLSWLHLLLSWIRAHGRRFYNFDGLDAFKAKFRPDRWETLFAVSNEARFSVRTLYAIAAAFSEGSPAIAVGRAMVSALRQEAAWFAERWLLRRSLRR